MANNICFNRNTFLFGIIVIIIIVIFVDKFVVSKDSSDRPSIAKTDYQEKHLENTSQTSTTIINQKPVRTISREEILYRRDHNALKNPLAPPTRRNSNYMYPPFTIPLNIPTRGYPDTYQYYGNLRRAADEKIVKLFGRQKFHGSNEYEYYGIISDSNGSDVKIQIDHTRELYDDDEIDIEFLDTSKGKFKLYINKFDTPKYNPYFI